MKQYILIYDKDDPSQAYIYGYHENVIFYHSEWSHSIKLAINKDLLHEYEESLEKLLKNTPYSIIYNSTKPLTIENNPELFI